MDYNNWQENYFLHKYDDTGLDMHIILPNVNSSGICPRWKITVSIETLVAIPISPQNWYTPGLLPLITDLALESPYDNFTVGEYYYNLQNGNLNSIQTSMVVATGFKELTEIEPCQNGLSGNSTTTAKRFQPYILGWVIDQLPPLNPLPCPSNRYEE